MNHPDNIKGFVLSDLAFLIEELRYDRLADFLEYLAGAFRGRAYDAENAGKKLLALRLKISAFKIVMSSYAVRDVWKLCEPHTDVKDHKHEFIYGWCSCEACLECGHPKFGHYIYDDDTSECRYCNCGNNTR